MIEEAGEKASARTRATETATHKEPAREIKGVRQTDRDNHFHGQ